MLDIAIILILLAVIGLASLYIIRAKKRGQTCIGCPYAKNGNCAGGCPCHPAQ